VAVVGGGPAGAICAALLARAGASAVLFDRPRPTRASVELVSGPARRLLAEIGSGFAGEPPGVDVSETVSVWGGSGPSELPAMLSPWGPGRAVDRGPFDRALRRWAAAAGAVVVAASVRSAERLDRWWQLSVSEGAATCSIYARELVLATGRGGRLLERSRRVSPEEFAITARIAASSAHRNALLLEEEPTGWWYALPDPAGGCFAGFCTSRAPGRAGRSLVGQWVGQLRATRLIDSAVASSVAPTDLNVRVSGAILSWPTSGEGWLAIGDAAFAPDPLSGKGIEAAVESAQRAAVAVLLGGSPANVGAYTEWARQYALEHERAQASFRTRLPSSN
jgi:flavin-dependent dehydrogenase